MVVDKSSLPDVSDVIKSTYLRSLLEGEAQECIEGLSLSLSCEGQVWETRENYLLSCTAAAHLVYR